MSVDRSGEVDMTLIRILRDRFTKTDFNYGYSDSPDARAQGQEQVKNAEVAFRSFAQRSPAHADVASAAWDQATDIYRPPEGYVRPNDRLIPVERTNELLREAAQLDRADRMAQAEREIAARHAQRATDTAEGKTRDATPTPQPRALTADEKKLADRAERMAEAERDIAARQAKGKDRDSGHGL